MSGTINMLMAQMSAGGGGGGTPDLINETFEGTGAPTHWGAGGAGVDWDYTAAPLSGSQSVRCDGAVGASVNYSGGTMNHSEVWFSFLIKFESLPAGVEYFCELSTDYRLRIQSDGTLLVHDASATLVGQTVSAMSAGTAYQVWGHYKKGTGANAVLECSFDTPGSARPNSGNKHAGGTNGDSTANAASVLFGFGSGAAAVIDNVQFASTDVF